MSRDLVVIAVVEVAAIGAVVVGTAGTLYQWAREYHAPRDYRPASQRCEYVGRHRLPWWRLLLHRVGVALGAAWAAIVACRMWRLA